MISYCLWEVTGFMPYEKIFNVWDKIMKYIGKKCDKI